VYDEHPVITAIVKRMMANETTGDADLTKGRGTRFSAVHGRMVLMLICRLPKFAALYWLMRLKRSLAFGALLRATVDIKLMHEFHTQFTPCSSNILAYTLLRTSCTA